MQLLTDFTLLTALLTATALATPLAKKDRFTVYQTVSKSLRGSGPSALVYSYRKYRKNVPKQLHRAHMKLKASQNGTVTANPNMGDEEYVCQVTVGGQTVNLDFDTGSSDLWVYSSELPPSDIGNHSIYNPQKSGAAKQLQGSAWTITYGDGSSASGDVYTDTVSVGGATAGSQAVELASTVSSSFLKDFSNDGLLGLGFDSGNTITPTPQKTFFTNVKSSLASPLFTVDLKHSAPGSYDFGFIDPDKYSGDIVYLDADSSQGFWGVNSTSWAVGDPSNTTIESISAIIDTGTTLLLVPQDVLDGYYSQVNGAVNNISSGGYTFPCDAFLPDFYIGFGSYTATVPASAINTGPVSPDGSTCFGGIQFSDPSNGPMGIYGDVFLKSSFIIFQAPDAGTPSLGFAAKADASSTAPVGPLTPISSTSDTPTSTDGPNSSDSSMASEIPDTTSSSVLSGSSSSGESSDGTDTSVPYYSYDKRRLGRFNDHGHDA